MNIETEALGAGFHQNIAIVVVGVLFCAYFVVIYFGAVRDLLNGRPQRIVRAADRLLRRENYAGAIAKYSSALAKQPTNVQALLGRSSAYIRAENGQKAIADCDRVMEIDGRNFGAYLNRGAVYLLNKEYEQALEDFSKCIELQPDCIDAFYNRGCLQMERDNRNDAIDDLSNAIRLNPSDANPYWRRGYIHLLNDAFKEAVKDLSKALGLGNTAKDTYRFRAYALTKLGDFEHAIFDYETVLRAAPDDAESLNGLAWCLATSPIEKLRNGVRAVKLATQSCELLNYDEWYCVGTLAAAFAETNNFDTAIEWAKKSLAMAPDDEKQECIERLELFESDQPFRVPFVSTG